MFGGFVAQMGKMIIAYGISMSAFKKAFTNPIAAIVAGAALVVIGSAISNYAAKGPSGAGGGAAAGYGGGGTGGNIAFNNPANFANQELVAEVSGDKLLFILERAAKNQGRVR
jgi:hypothetical protein